MASLKAVCQILRSSLWSHKRLYKTLFIYAVVKLKELPFKEGTIVIIRLIYQEVSFMSSAEFDSVMVTHTLK